VAICATTLGQGGQQSDQKPACRKPGLGRVRGCEKTKKLQPPLLAKLFAKFFADGRSGIAHLVGRPQQLLSAHSEMPRQIFHFICVACGNVAAIRSDFLCKGSRHEATLRGIG